MALDDNDKRDLQYKFKRAMTEWVTAEQVRQGRLNYCETIVESIAKLDPDFACALKEELTNEKMKLKAA